MSSKEFHHLQDPLAKKKALHTHLKVISTWLHLPALCNALWQMSNYGTATPRGNHPGAAFSPGYRHKGLITPSRREQWGQASRGPLLSWCVGWYGVRHMNYFSMALMAAKQLGWCVSWTLSPVVKGGRLLLKRKKKLYLSRLHAEIENSYNL